MNSTDFLSLPLSFVVEWGGKSPCAVLVHSVQSAADQAHSYACLCSGIRWIDCQNPKIKNEIKLLFDIKRWELVQPGDPFRWSKSFASGYVSVTRVTDKSAPHRFLEFTVPLLPPSVNHYKLPNQYGGWRITKEAQAFTDAAAIFARAASPANWPWNIDAKTAGIRPFYEVDLTFYIEKSSYLKLDSDNLEKVAFDALVKCGAITDDRYIKYHTNRAQIAPDKQSERTEYTVRIVPEPTHDR